MKIKNDKGEEIEVFTAEEVSAREKTASEEAATKAVEDFKASNPDKTAELEEAKTALADAQKALEDAESSGENKGQIERLRKERDDAKKLAEDANKGLDKKFEAWKNERLSEDKDDYLDRLSSGDVELRKKIELEFDNYRKDATSKKDLRERMEKAFVLATGNKPAPNLLDGRTSASDRGAGGGYSPPADSKEVSANQKAIGRVLGITDKDREEHKKYLDYKKEKQELGLIPPNA